MVDLRSDTVTRPSAAMREAIASAEVGDDVFGEDPTVNRLQEMVAELLGKQAALFVPSGTMANEIAINAHTSPGDEVICEAGAHIFNYEGGAPALLSGVQLHPIEGVDGLIAAGQVREALGSPDAHYPQTGLVVLENTHNRAGGVIIPLDGIEAVARVAQNRGVPVHLDGARLLNAVVATGIPAATWAAPFDSVSICFSKGLGAPVGSALAGSADFISKAHRYRKAYGGGMRQAGILAAAGIYALEHNVERLAEDHANARLLAEALDRIDGLSVQTDKARTNIVMIDVEAEWGSANDVAEALAQREVLVLAIAPQQLRALTHLDVSRQDVEVAIAEFEMVLSSLNSGRPE